MGNITTTNGDGGKDEMRKKEKDPYKIYKYSNMFLVFPEHVGNVFIEDGIKLEEVNSKDLKNIKDASDDIRKILCCINI